MSELTAQARARKWVRAEIEGKSELHIPTVVDEMVAQITQDPEWVQQIVDEMFRPLAYQIVVQTVARSRPGGLVIVGDDAMTPDARKAKARALSGRWNGWLEHVGDRHVRLLEMTRTDLQVAAAERRRRGDTEYAYAELWDALAERLEGDERVRERFTEEEIELVRQSLAATRAEEAA